MAESFFENKPEKRINKKGEAYEEKNVFYHSTFRKLCYWLSLMCDVLENEKADPSKFMKNGQVDIETVRKVLNRVAVVNLKKSWGDKQTNFADLKKYVENPKIANVLRKQMEKLSPIIVLCCSPDVYYLAKKVYGSQDDYEFSEPSKSILGKNIEFSNINNAIYVNFYHPQCYRKTDEVFSDFAIETFEYLKTYLNNLAETLCNYSHQPKVIDIGLCGNQHVHD